MITTSMLRRQVWMTDDDEFDHIVKNSQRVLKLNDQYENHPSVKEFTKQCSVMFIYGTSDVKLSLINRMRAWSYLQKTSDLPLNMETIRQTHKIMMDDVLAGGIESHLHLQAIIFLHRLVILKDTWKTQFLGFMKLKRMIQSWPLQICLEA